jgi:hypothetical protein
MQLVQSSTGFYTVRKARQTLQLPRRRQKQFKERKQNNLPESKAGGKLKDLRNS